MGTFNFYCSDYFISGKITTQFLFGQLVDYVLLENKPHYVTSTKTKTHTVLSLLDKSSNSHSSSVVCFGSFSSVVFCFYVCICVCLCFLRFILFESSVVLNNKVK